MFSQFQQLSRRSNTTALSREGEGEESLPTPFFLCCDGSDFFVSKAASRVRGLANATGRERSRAKEKNVGEEILAVVLFSCLDSFPPRLFAHSSNRHSHPFGLPSRPSLGLVYSPEDAFLLCDVAPARVLLPRRARCPSWSWHRCSSAPRERRTDSGSFRASSNCDNSLGRFRYGHRNSYRKAAVDGYC